MAAPTLRKIAATNLDTTGAALAGFDVTDTGALLRGGVFCNGDSASDNLLVSIDGGSTFPIVIAPGTNYALPPSTRAYRVGGQAGNGLWWKAGSNTVSACSFIYLAYAAAADVV